MFVLIVECFAFLTSLFAVAKGSRRTGAAKVSKRDTWVKCNSCFTFAFRKYIHESCQFVKFMLDIAQFVLFLSLLFTAWRGSFLAEICSGHCSICG